MENRDKKVELKIKDVKKAIKVAEKLAYQDPEEAVKAKERGNEKFKVENTNLYRAAVFCSILKFPKKHRPSNQPP
jgi:hypothetical protein